MTFEQSHVFHVDQILFPFSGVCFFTLGESSVEGTKPSRLLIAILLPFHEVLYCAMGETTGRQEHQGILKGVQQRAGEILCSFSPTSLGGSSNGIMQRSQWLRNRHTYPATQLDFISRFSIEWKTCISRFINFNTRPLDTREKLTETTTIFPLNNNNFVFNLKEK